MSRLVNKMQGQTLRFLGLGGKKKKTPEEEPELAMPDEVELRRKARRRQAELAARGGRASTILDDETLG